MFASIALIENAGAEPSPTRSEATRANLVDSIQDVTRKALDWMQRDGEQQAKENKAMQELLYGVILVVNDVVRDLVSADAAIYCHHIAEVNQWRELSMDKVEDLVSEWEDVLAEWKQVALEEKQELKESVGLFQEEYDARLQSLMRSHVLERGKLRGLCCAASHCTCSAPSSVTQCFVHRRIEGANSAPRFALQPTAK